MAVLLGGAVALVVLHHVGGYLELQSGSQLRIVAGDELRQVHRAELPHPSRSSRTEDRGEVVTDSDR